MIKITRRRTDDVSWRMQEFDYLSALIQPISGKKYKNVKPTKQRARLMPKFKRGKSIPKNWLCCKSNMKQVKDNPEFFMPQLKNSILPVTQDWGRVARWLAFVSV